MNDSTRSDRQLRDVIDQPVDRPEALPPCLDDETVWRAAHAELDEAGLGRVLDHVAGCDACAESWRMAQAIRREASIADSSPRVVPFRRRPVVWAVGSVAAAILLVSFLLPTILDRDPPVGSDEFRVPATTDVRSLLDESVPVSRDDVVLRWTGAPTGALFTVEVADETLSVLARSAPSEHPEYRVPPEVLVGLPAGATVYWRVEIVLPDATRASSATFILRLQ